MSKTRPGLALAFMAFMFSLAGIPPLFGFYPKLAVFNAAVAAGLFPLAVLAVVGSVIGAYYYIRIVKTMYFDDPAPAFAVSGSALDHGLLAAPSLARSEQPRLGHALFLSFIFRWSLFPL